MIIVRHARATPAGRLFGRTDAAAKLDDAALLPRIRRAVGAPPKRFASPARRAKETAAAIWPGLAPATEDARLWEQDFGDWDGLPFDEVPDIGQLADDDLARHRPPNGESFQDVCARVWPAMRELSALATDTAIVAHAGVIRAAIALALKDPAAGLKFEAAPLSITRLRCLGGDRFAVAATNWLPQ